MSQRYPLIALLVFPLLVAPLTRANTGGLDQSFEPFLGDGSANTLLQNPGGVDTRLAQGVTVGRSGTLTCVEVFVAREHAAPGDLVLEIQAVDGAAVPTGAVLASATVGAQDVPTSLSWVAFDLSADALAVGPGETYAIVLRAEEAAAPEIPWYRWCGESGADATYPGGATRSRLTGNPWVLLDRDSGFRTYVDTGVPVDSATWGGIKRLFADR